MIDFDQAKIDAFSGIAQTNVVERVNQNLNVSLGFKHDSELIRIITEAAINGSIKEFNLLVELKADFPLSLPGIFLSEDDFESIKYIPHVDDVRKICLFDQENIKIDPDRPVEILKLCLNRAVGIIEGGVKKNNGSEFKDEIVAYWANTYNSKDKVVGAYFCEGVETLEPGKTTLQYISPSYNKVNLIWGVSDEFLKKVLTFFKMRGNKIEELDGFYLGSVDSLMPPFSFNNKNLVLFLKKHFAGQWPEIKRYLNDDLKNKQFIFSIVVDKELIYFGFYISGFKIKFNGWRDKSLNTVTQLTTTLAAKSVERLCFSAFSPERLKKRTDGVLAMHKPYKFMVAGLGSIGSNLIYYLKALEVSDFKLIDPEVLQLENVNRHLLSFNDVGRTKVNGVADHLLFKDPFLSVTKHASSIINVIQSELNEINKFDLLFCAIGKDAIETYLLQCLADGKLEKPIVFLWVEPYLLGAHVLYINPGTTFKLKDLEVNGYYKFNVVAPETYKSEQQQLLLKEAGCQDSYIPYGKEAIVDFFSVIIPQLYEVIRLRKSDNFAMTYIGDKNLAEKLGLPLSDFTQQQNSYSLVKQKL